MLALIPSDLDRRFLLAWLKSAELSKADAEALGFVGLSIPERRRVVKQIRERIVKRLRRHSQCLHSNGKDPTASLGIATRARHTS